MGSELLVDSPMKKRQTKKVTPERLQEFGFAYAPPLIISAAVNNKVFDSLQGRAKTVEQLKKETGADARGLRAIMVKKSYMVTKLHRYNGFFSTL